MLNCNRNDNIWFNWTVLERNVFVCGIISQIRIDNRTLYALAFRSNGGHLLKTDECLLFLSLLLLFLLLLSIRMHISSVQCCTGTQPTHYIFPFRVVVFIHSFIHSCAYQSNWRSLQCTICTKWRRSSSVSSWQVRSTLALNTCSVRFIKKNNRKKFDADIINMCVKLKLKLETHVTNCSHPFCFVGVGVVVVLRPKLWLAAWFTYSVFVLSSVNNEYLSLWDFSFCFPCFPFSLCRSL